MIFWKWKIKLFLKLLLSFFLHFFKICYQPNFWYLIVHRNINGMLLDTILCVTCVQGTYPSLDCTKCLPCDNREYSGHINCICPSATHVRLRNYCLRKNDIVDWPNIRSTYLMKFRNENVDSYYLRNELQVTMHLCKVCRKLNSRFPLKIKYQSNNEYDKSFL